MLFSSVFLRVFFSPLIYTFDTKTYTKVGWKKVLNLVVMEIGENSAHTVQSHAVLAHTNGIGEPHAEKESRNLWLSFVYTVFYTHRVFLLPSNTNSGDLLSVCVWHCITSFTISLFIKQTYFLFCFDKHRCQHTVAFLSAAFVTPPEKFFFFHFFFVGKNQATAI